MIKDEFLENNDGLEDDVDEFAVVEQQPTAHNVQTATTLDPESTRFGEAMEAVKLNILKDASANDDKFVKEVTETAKSAAVKNVEAEKKKADLEMQKVDYKSEVLATEQERNAHLAAENKWENRQKRRQYHYNGVKPIMTFVGINDPLNLPLLYFLTLVIAPFFLLDKILRGTIGVLVSGAVDQDRPKSVKGFLWTLIAIIAVLALAVAIYLFLKWQGIINV